MRYILYDKLNRVRNKIKPYWLLLFFILHSSLFIISCSETKNLAEGETLYTGIKKVTYELPAKPEAEKNDTTGVIIALGNAYNTVNDYLSGEKREESGERNELANEGRNVSSSHVSLLTTDSKKDREAYATAKSEVEGVLAYKPNNSLMGSSYYRQPLAVGLWTYNRYVYSQHRFGKWMFNTFAASPVYLTTVNPRIRAQVARNTLRNHGYFRAQTSYEEVPQKNPRKAKVSYHIQPGPLFHIDSVAYLGFTGTADSIIHATLWASKVRRGDPFSATSLDAERTRLTDHFRNHGYYYVRPEHIVFRADTIARPLFVQLQVVPSPTAPPESHRQYQMGRTHINVYEHGTTQLTDTLSRPEKMSRRMRKQIKRYISRREKKEDRGENSGEKRDTLRPTRRRTITMAHSGRPGRPPLKMRAIYRFINYRPGDLYDLSLQKAMQENLTSMGIFSQVSVKYKQSGEWSKEQGARNKEQEVCIRQNEDSLQKNSLAPCPLPLAPQDTLDVDITLRLDRPYDAEFKGNIATKSNGLVGPGVSFTMSKQNVFRGAETLSFQAYGSYEWMTGAQARGKRNLLNSYEWGTSLSLTYPRLLLLGTGWRFNRRARATTTYKISADWMNRSGYFSRVSFGGRVVHTYQRRPTIYHEVVPLRLDYEKQLHTTAKFDSIIARNQALYASLRDQFVPSAQYTITMTNKRKVRYDRRLTLSLKEAGNLTSLAYAIGGQSFQKTGKNLFGVPFAQYLRFTAEFVESFRLFHTKTHLVLRLYGGTVYSYGNAATAPYNDLFTVGGANSIRAFGVRTIGPGSYHPQNSGYSYLDQMGDLRLEANLEYRFPLVSQLYGAMFVDAGNVWLLKKDPSRPGGSINLHNLGREIALGTGFGLRYDLSFLVVRFDVGIGIHAPYDTGHSGYYNMGKFWNSLGFHLAVGYPF